MVLHKRSNIIASVAKHLKFQEKLSFTHALLVNSAKLKQKIWDQETLHFQVAIYSHERCNNTAPFAEQIKFLEKMTFMCWVNCGKSKQKD